MSSDIAVAKGAPEVSLDDARLSKAATVCLVSDNCETRLDVAVTSQHSAKYLTCACV